MNTPNDSRPLQPPAEAETDRAPELGVSHGSASCAPDDRPDDDDFDNGEGRCHVCLGDGYVFGDEMDDPDWYEPGKTYNCPCCRGSGDAKDCTYW